MKINATTFASLPILARKLRWQFEKTIILQTMLAKVQDFREPASRSQIIAAGDA
jgi:hypothetical protein